MPGTYPLYNRDSSITSNNPLFDGSKQGNIGNYNVNSSYPNYLSINPTTFSAHGIIMFNSSPTQVVIADNYLTFKMTSGIIELFVLAGPTSIEVTKQLHLTLGYPILPPYSALNWQASFITSNPTVDILKYKQELEDFKKNYSYPVNCKL